MKRFTEQWQDPILFVFSLQTHITLFWCLLQFLNLFVFFNFSFKFNYLGIAAFRFRFNRHLSGLEDQLQSNYLMGKLFSKSSVFNHWKTAFNDTILIQTLAFLGLYVCLSVQLSAYSQLESSACYSDSTDFQCTIRFQLHLNLYVQLWHSLLHKCMHVFWALNVSQVQEMDKLI